MFHLYAHKAHRWMNYGSGVTDAVTAITKVLCLLVLSSTIISGFNPSRLDIVRGKIRVVTPPTDNTREVTSTANSTDVTAHKNVTVLSEPLAINARASSDLPSARQIFNFNPNTTSNITVNGQTIFLTPAQQQLLITLLTNVLRNDTTVTPAPPTNSLSPVLANLFANSNYGLRVGDFLGTTGLASQAAQSFINPFRTANSNSFTSAFNIGNPDSLDPFGVGSPSSQLFQKFPAGFSSGQLVNNNNLASLLQVQNGPSSLPGGFQSVGTSPGFSGSSLQTVLNPNSLLNPSLGSLIPGSQLDGINVGSSTDLVANGFARIANPSSFNQGGSVMFQ